MKTTNALIGIVTITVSSCAYSAFGQGSIFDNLGTPITSSAEVLEGAAQPFQTDSQSYFFDSAQLNLQYNPRGTDPIQIDVGRFGPRTKPFDKNEIIRITDHLHAHLNKNCPELGAHLKTQIENL